MRKIKSIIFIFMAFFVLFIVSDINKVAAATTYNVSVSINNSEGGTVSASRSTCSYNIIWGFIDRSDSVTVTLNMTEGYTFLGWRSANSTQILSQDFSYNYKCKSSESANKMTAYVAKIDEFTAAVNTDGDVYRSLGDALSAGKNNVNIMVLKNHSIEKISGQSETVYTIPSGVKVILPYEYFNWNDTENGSADNATGILSWSSEEGVNKYRYVHLTIDEGVTLKVYGTLSIAAVLHYPGQQSQGIASGMYSQITNNGNIVVDGGTVYCYGRLDGTGLLTMNSGNLHEPFLINDYAGGTNLTAFIKAGEMPFKQYALINIECDQIIKYGTTVHGVTSMYANRMLNVQTAAFIGTGHTDHMFSLENSESYIELSYNPSKTIKKTNLSSGKLGNIDLSSVGVTTLVFHGDIKFGELSIQGYSSKDYGFFGLPYSFEVVIASDCTANILSGYNYKVLPGSTLTVEEGGKLIINENGGLLVYDALIQGDKSSKFYPSSQILKDNNFSPNAVFILNGEIEIKGTFAGIIQTTGTSAIINVASSATLYKYVKDGAPTGYTDDYGDNQTEFHLYARIYGIYGYSNLEAGKTYKSFDNNSFVLESFTAEDIGHFDENFANKVESRVLSKTVTLNQPMTGRFVEWDGEKFATSIKFYIGEETDESNLIVIINDIENKVGSNGYFDSTLTFSNGDTMYYYTRDKENKNILHSFQLISLPYGSDQFILLDSVVKSVRQPQSEYIKYDDEEMFDIDATVEFYGDKEDITINTKEIVIEDNKIIYLVNLEDENDIYIIENASITFTNIPRALEVYNSDVLLLDSAENLVEYAISLWSRYESFLTGKNELDIKYINDHVDYSYGDKIVKEIGSLIDFTYGDEIVLSNTLKVDGSNTVIEFSVSNWKSEPILSADIEYNGLYKETIPYFHKATITSNINSKEIELIINDVDDNNEIHTPYKVNKDLTIALKEGYNLVLEEQLENVVEVSREQGFDAKTYDINIRVIHAGYSIANLEELSLVKYIIDPIPVSVVVTDYNPIRDDRIGRNMNIVKEYTIDGELDTPITYRIENSDSLVVAKVDKDGKVSILDEEKYVAGNYKIVPEINSVNYTLTSNSANLTVIAKYEYYSVVVKLNNEVIEEKYDYTAQVYELFTSVNLNIGDRSEVKNYSVTVNTVNAKDVIIKDAKIYNILIVVDEVDYRYSFEIEKRVLELESDAPEFYLYNNSKQVPNITIKNLIGDDSVILDLQVPNSVNAGNYSILVSDLKDESNKNYILPLDENLVKFDYVIKKLDIDIIINDYPTIRDDRIGYQMNISKEVSLNGELYSPITYIINDSQNTSVAKVDKDGNVTILNEEKYVPGEYTIIPVIDPVNYNLTYTTSSFSVISKYDYYSVDININDEEVQSNYDYTSYAYNLTVSVYLNVNSKEEVRDYAVTVNDINLNAAIIKDAKVYTVIVVVDDVEYRYTFEINKIVLEIESNVPEFYTYNGLTQEPTITISNLIGSDLVILDIEKPESSVDVGNYSINIVGLDEQSNPNYKLPSDESLLKFDYQIKALNLTINVADHSNIMDLYKDNPLILDIYPSVPDKFKGLVQFLIKDTSDNLIAKVINGRVIEEEGKTYGVGNYKVYAHIDSTNFIVTGDYGDLEIVENNEYYRVDVKYFNISGNEITSSIYDGNDVSVEIKVYINDESNEAVEDFSYSINDMSIKSFNQAGTYKVNVIIAGYSYGEVSSFTIEKRTIELTSNISEYTYNGEIYSPKVNIANLVENDDVELIVNYPVSINAGTYTIVVEGIKSGSNPNYVLSQDESQLTFTYVIDKITISIAVEDIYPIRESKVTDNMIIYSEITTDATLDPDITYLIKEVNSNILVATVDEYGKVTLTGNSNYLAGSYFIEPSVDRINYDLTYQIGNFNVVRDVDYFSVIAKIDSKNIERSYEYTSKELEFTSVVNIVTPYTAVDDYIVTVNGISLEDAIIKDAGNYIIVINVDGVKYEYSFTITKIVLELEIDKDLFVYNGQEQTPVVIATNLKGEDSLSFLIESSTSVDANTYSMKVVGIRNRSHLNYELPELEEKVSFEYKIEPKPVDIVMGNHDQIRVGKVTSNISFDKAISDFSGLNPNISYEIRDKNNNLIAKVSDDGSVTLEEGVTYGVGEYTIHPVIKSKNYALSYTSSTIVVVEDAAYYLVSVSVNEEELKSNYLYDGNILELDIEVNVANPLTPVSDYIVLINQNEAKDVVIRNADTYQVVINVDGVIYRYNFEITQKEIDFTIDEDSFVYDGELHAPVFTLVNTIENDDISVNALSNTRFKGEYTINASLIGEDARNYKLLRPLTVDYTIEAMPITVRINNVSSIYGNAITSLTFTCSDTLAKGDNIYSFIRLTKEEGLNVGLYDIIPVNTNYNYEVTFENTSNSYEIKKRSIIVAVDSKTLTYGDDIKPLTATLSYGQLAYQDTLNSIVSLSREDTNNAGVYAINAINTSNNYDIEFASGTYTINQRNLTVFVDDYTSVYGDSMKSVEIEIIEGSLAYNHELEDLLVFDNELSKDVGVYILSLSKIYNPNYNIKINYTKTKHSIYEVLKRSITIETFDVSLDNSVTYDEVMDKVKYEITDGNIVDGDNLNIALSIVLQNGTTLNAENFASNFGGGEHDIIITASNSNYDIHIANAKLIVTKRVISIDGIVTEHVFNGEIIEIFNWRENIVNYDLLATDQSFTSVMYMKDENGEYVETDTIILAGEYKLVISIVHSHAYVFEEGTVSEYNIVVNKKDISDELFIYNIPNNNTSIYNSLGFTPGVELPEEYEYVEYIETLLWNGIEVSEAKNVGEYTYSVVVENMNYSGNIQVSFNITKKDLSQNILINILPDQLILIDELDSLDIRVNNYNVNKTIIYTKVNDPSVELTSITESGSYNMKVIIDDDNYTGYRISQIRVAVNVKNKIDRINELKTSFDNSSSIEEKTSIMAEIDTIIKGLDSYDLEQLEANNSYKNIVADANRNYENFNNYLEELANPNKDNTNLIVIIVSASLAAIILAIIVIIIIKRKKA